MPLKKQLYEVLTPVEIEALDPKERVDRLELCQHQLANKERALTWMTEPKPYMLAEVEGLRANIKALSGP